MDNRRSMMFGLIACSLVILLSCVEASDRLLLQIKPACKPGTYSPTGTDCKPCPPQAMCLRMALPCEMMPTCDPVTGKATSMCWVKKPAGSVCNPKYYGDQKIPAAEQTHVCSSEGECLPEGAAATDSSQPTQQKPAILPSPAVCKPGTYSPTGTDCKPCPPQAICARMALPCEMMPTCDPVTGKATSMCWVKKPAGSVCNPKYYGDQKIPAAEQTHACSSEGECLPAGADAANSSRLTQQKPAILPPKCPSTPMCRRAQGPCDKAPPCDASGKPTSMCWVPKPDGTACSPSGPAAALANSTSFICMKQQCIPAPAKLLDKNNATNNSSMMANSSTAAIKCPTTPMCRRLALPCEMAPPCDSRGRPISMCWVAMPNGSQCRPGAEAVMGMKYVCKDRDCVPA